VEDHLIVDGYNVLNHWPELAKLMEKSVEHARDRLVDIMANYRALKGNRVTVVFDGHLVKGGTGSRENVAGVEVIYSGEGKTADAVIERLVAVEGVRGTVAVATSDYVEQQLILGKGAVRITPKELLQQVTITNGDAGGFLRGRQSLQALDQRLDDRVRQTLEEWRRRK